MVIALSTTLWLLSGGIWLTAASARPPARPDLSISITDGRTSAARGDHLRYVVVVRNAGAATARNVSVTLTAPSYLSVSSASRRAMAKAGKVTWRTSLRAGRTVSFTATATLGRTPRGMGHLAVIACARQHASTPVICAAHLDALPGAGAASSRSGAVPGTASGTQGADGASGGLRGYLYAGLAVLACGLLGALAARRFRGRKAPGHAR